MSKNEELKLSELLILSSLWMLFGFMIWLLPLQWPCALTRDH